MGAFLIDMLEGEKLNGLKSYTVDNLEAFLTRKSDKELMVEVIEKLRGKETLLNNKTNNGYPDINNRS